jgi:Ser-tRNA(Ala) deacylase AlaX
MMLMDRIYGFERQPYLRELEVEVLRLQEESGAWTAILDDTILYPEGGGQPSDRGRLNEVVVSHVQKTSEGLLHVLESPVEPGAVRLVVDWDRRYDHMQQHTAQHILTRTARDRLSWETRSFHIGAEVSDIELDCRSPKPAEIEALEDAVAEIIVEARPIRGFRVSREEFAALDVRSRGLPAGHQGEIRLVEIEDFDLNTCGGTHLASTSEVEIVKIVGSEPLRGGCRVFWVAGKRVRRRLASHDRTMAELRRLLDIGDAEMVSGLGSRLEQLQEARRARRGLERRLAESIVRELSSAESAGLVDLHLEGLEAGLLRLVAEGLAKQGGRRAVLLTAEGEAGIQFALVTGEESGLDLKAAGAATAEILNGRGGGSGKVFQGKAESLARRSDAVNRIRELLS